jgi:hypothetical protein
MLEMWGCGIGRMSPKECGYGRNTSAGAGFVAQVFLRVFFVQCQFAGIGCPIRDSTAEIDSGRNTLSWGSIHEDDRGGPGNSPYWDRMRRLPRLFPALALTSCLDPTAPAPGRNVEVAFCVAPAWAAYRNENASWQRLQLPSAVVRLTDRVAIATVWATSNPSLQVHHLTADQVEASFSCPASDGPVGKLVQTNVAGIDANDQVYAMLGSSIAYRSDVGPLTFTGVPAGPQDLVAARQVFETSSMRVPGVIVRRSLDLASGTILPPLDFASAEAIAPLAHTITLTEPGAATYMGGQVDFVSASGAQATIGGMGGTSANLTGWSLPPFVLTPGDLHILSAGANSAGLHRSFLFFYRNGADRTFSLGPTPNAPVFSAPPAGVVVRATVVSQPEYPAQVTLSLSTASHSVQLTATREYFGGTPATWPLDLPDLRGLPGFQDEWMFPAESASWTVSVSGQPYGFRVADARAGDLFRSAHLSGPAALVVPR